MQCKVELWRKRDILENSIRATHEERYHTREQKLPGRLDQPGNGEQEGARLQEKERLQVLTREPKANKLMTEVCSNDYDDYEYQFNYHDAINSLHGDQSFTKYSPQIKVKLQ